MKVLLITFFILSLTSCGSMGRQNKAEYTEAATLWVQNAAEFRALSYQAFNSARLYLDRALLTHKGRKKPAVVVDIDETVLDNSPYQAMNILKNRNFERKYWDEWIKLAEAKAIPGSIDFLNYAHKKGVEVIYISNRKIKGLDATYKNLLNLGFPVKRQNIFLRTTTGNKEERRQNILRKYEIVILAGDTLADFSEVFHNKGTNDRNILVDKMRNDFGKKFIVLPNPMYGDWEAAMYNYNFSESDERKRKLRQGHLYPHN